MALYDEQNATSSAASPSVLTDFDALTEQMRTRLLQLESRASSQTHDLQTVANLSRQIATYLTLNDLLPQVVELTKAQFDLYHAHIYLLDETAPRLYLAAGAGAAGQRMLQIGHAINLLEPSSIVAQAARDQQPVVINDVRRAETFLPNSLLPETRAEVAIPMIVGDELVGILDVQSNRANSFEETRVQVIRTLAAQIAVAVKNAQAFERVMEAEARTAAALRETEGVRFAIDQHAIVAITDTDGIITYVNDQFCHSSGYTADELIGQDNRILNSGYHSKEFFRDLWETVAAGKVWKGEIRNRTKDGSIFWVDSTIVPFLDAAGKPYQYIAIRYDTTDRKQFEEQLARRATQLELISAVSLEASTRLQLDDLLESVVNLTKDRLRLYHAHIYLLDSRHDNLVLAAGAGDAGKKMVAARHTINMQHVNSLVARAAREVTAQIANDVIRNPDYLPNPYLPSTRSELALPLVIGDEVLGVLDVQADRLNYFSDEDARVFATLAGQIAVAVNNARLFTETQYRARDLEITAIVAELLRSPGDLETTLENTLIATVEALEADNGVLSLFDREHETWNGWIGTGQGMTVEIARSFVDSKHRYPHAVTVLETGQVVAVENSRTYPDFPADIADIIGIKSVLTLPVFQDETVIGVLFLNYIKQYHRFTGPELSLARSISGQLSAGIQRRQAEDEVRRRARESEIITEISSEIAANLDLESLLWNIVNLTRDRFERYHAQIYLYQPDPDRLVLRAGAGYVGRTLVERGHSIPMDREASLVARAARSREVVVINDTTSEPGFMANSLLPDTKAEMTVPIVVGTKLIGVLDIQDNRTNTFDAVIVQSKRVLANQIGVAIENAQAFAAVEAAREETARLFNASIDMLGSATFAGMFTSLNPAWSKTLGFSNDELLAEPFINFVHPDDVEATLAEAGKIADGATAIQFINRYRTKDGSYRWISWNSAPDMANNLIHFVARDITEEREAQAVLDQAREETERIFTTSYDMMGTANYQGYFTRLNPAWSRNLGYTDEELLAQPFLSFVHPDDVEATLGEAAKIQAGAETVQFINRYRAKDGKYRLFSWTSTTDRDRNVIYFVARDITEEREAQAVLDQAREETERIFNTSYDMLGTATFEGYFTRLNPAWSRTLGYTDAELMAQPFISFVHPDDVEATLGEASKIQEGAETLQFINRYRASDGNYRWFSWTSTTDRENRVIYFVARDITEERAAQEQILIYADVVENTPTGMYVYHLEDETNPASLRLRVANAASQSATGVAPEQIVGKTIAEAFPNLMETAVPQIYADVALKGHEVELGEVTYRDENIEESVYYVRAFPLPNRSVGISFENITERKKAQLEIEEARKRAEARARELETVAQVSAQVTGTLDAVNLLQNVPDLIKERFNLYHAHIYLMDEDTQQLVLTAGAGEAGHVMKARGHHIPYTAETSIVAHAARTRRSQVINDVLSHQSFLPNPLLPETRAEMAIPMLVAGELVGVLDVQANRVGHFTDEDVRVKTTLANQLAIAVKNAQSFVELEQRAERERATAEQLRELDRLKSQFLANMSHELRTPLNSIIGYAEVLLDGVDGDLSDDMNEDVTAIYDSGRHLLSIINEILDLAKIEAGQMHLDRKRVELTEFVSEVVRTGQVLVKSKPVELRMVQESADPVILADPVRLRQVLWNLVSNGVKFTEQGSVTVAFGKTDDENAYVRVIDTGIGISEEHQRVIFERFSQVDGSSTRRAGGTGLGLTITQQLVQMHGGEIVVESTPGKGSTFSFTMPVYQPDPVVS